VLAEGRIETTTFKKVFLFLKPVGLDMAAEAEMFWDDRLITAAYSTNDLRLKQTTGIAVYQISG